MTVRAASGGGTPGNAALAGAWATDPGLRQNKFGVDVRIGARITACVRPEQPDRPYAVAHVFDDATHELAQGRLYRLLMHNPRVVVAQRQGKSEPGPSSLRVARCPVQLPELSPSSSLANAKSGHRLTAVGIH